MIPVCDYCGEDITASNRRWPGYCTAACRTAARDLSRAQRRARRLTAAWTERTR